jgi:hypothetical protein
VPAAGGSVGHVLRESLVRRVTLLRKYPEQKSLPMPLPKFADVRIFRLTPMVISVLDYSKGFGHTDCVTC